MIGRTLGHYETVSLLSAGGMGEVYRARDTRLNREVAIKMLPLHLTQDAAALARFEREAQAVAALSHPNILAIHDFGDEHGVLYAVMELLDGQTLRERLNSPPLNWREAVDIAAAIADGLAAAHAKGIIHRDLKPENVFLTRDGRVKILDFGLARVKPPMAERQDGLAPTVASVTEPGMVMGTAGYMSPEQVRGEEADAESDIFAFGCVLYELLTGRRAFARPSAAETIVAILQDQPPALAEAATNLPPELESVVRHCLEKKAEHRFEAARDLSFALRALLGRSSATPVHSQRARLRLAPVVWGLVGASLLAALVFANRTLNRTPQAASSIRFAVALPGAWVGTEVESSFMAVSPDGQHMAFVVESEGLRKLWVRSRDSVSATMLPGSEGAASPFWSPDSRWIGFFARGQLKKIEAAGGPPQVLCNLPIAVGSASWGRDGTILFAGQGGDAEGIHRVSDTGGQTRLVIKPDKSRGEAWHFWPQFLPDGRHFLYLTSDSAFKGDAVVIGSLDAEPGRVLIRTSSRVEYIPPGYLLYVSDGTLMARRFDVKTLGFTGEPIPIADQVRYFSPTGYADFSASESLIVYRAGEIASQLVWVDRNGRQLEVVGKRGQYEEPRLSPDGRRVALGIVDPTVGTMDILALDLTRNLSTRVTTGRRNTEYGPVWSPDGKSLAFVADLQGPPHLHRMAASGAGEAEALVPPESQVQWADDWSSDGRFIVYAKSSTRTSTDIWVLPLFGDRTPFPLLNSPFAEREARFSPDGRWIAYVSDESGANDVYVRLFRISAKRADEKWKISTAGGSQPVWRRDGRELFYLATDNRLMAVPVKAAASFEAAAPTTLFKTESAAEHSYDVAADGQRFLINANVTKADALPITAVVNWTASLKR